MFLSRLGTGPISKNVDRICPLPRTMIKIGDRELSTDESDLGAILRSCIGINQGYQKQDESDDSNHDPPIRCHLCTEFKLRTGIQNSLESHLRKFPCPVPVDLAAFVAAE